jgi:hypothetical protein
MSKGSFKKSALIPETNNQCYICCGHCSNVMKVVLGEGDEIIHVDSTPTSNKIGTLNMMREAAQLFAEVGQAPGYSRLEPNGRDYSPEELGLREPEKETPKQTEESKEMSDYKPAAEAHPEPKPTLVQRIINYTKEVFAWIIQ